WHETLAGDMAAGYTLATGKMQGVLLHAGAGLLQGAMGIHGAFVTGVPMVVISGESMTYGEQPEFDPGAQWMNNLSIVGGTTSLVDTIVKYASVAGSAYTLYESVIRAGELAQRQTNRTRLPLRFDRNANGCLDATDPSAHGAARASHADCAGGYRKTRRSALQGEASSRAHRGRRSGNRNLRGSGGAV